MNLQSCHVLPDVEQSKANLEEWKREFDQESKFWRAEFVKNFFRIRDSGNNWLNIFCQNISKSICKFFDAIKALFLVSSVIRIDKIVKYRQFWGVCIRPYFVKYFWLGIRQIFIVVGKRPNIEQLLYVFGHTAIVWSSQTFVNHIVLICKMLL